MAAKMDIQKIWTRGEHEGFTAYMIATIVNEELAAKGLEQIRPQMMYNYSKNGLINGVKNQHAVRGYTTPEVVEFVNRFVAMRAAKGTKTTPTPEPQTVEDIDELVAKLLAQKSELQGTTNA